MSPQLRARAALLKGLNSPPSTHTEWLGPGYLISSLAFKGTHRHTCAHTNTQTHKYYFLNFKNKKKYQWVINTFKCSIFLFIGQIKARFHFTPVRMDLFKNKTKQNPK